MANHAECLTLIAAVQADAERMGHKVFRVKMTVAEMTVAIAAEGMENTPNNRAAIVALHGGIR